MEMIKVFEMIAEKISEGLIEGRNIEYSEGAVGITGLIYCPLKHQFRLEHPEVKARSVEIDDGFAFEAQVKDALVKTWGKAVKPEYVVRYVSPRGQKVEGHIDVVINGREKVIAVECKNTKLSLHNLPFGSVDEDCTLLTSPDLVSRISISDAYILQSRMQKMLLQRQTSKPVEHYLLIKSMIKIPAHGYKKVLIVRKTTEDMSEAELNGIIDDFLDRKEPRYAWECSYCQYRKAGLCEGMEWHGEDDEDNPELSPAAQEAIAESIELAARLRDLEAFLKKEINGQVEIPNGGRPRKIGWVEKTRYDWDMQKLFDVIGPDIQKYMLVNWRKLDELEKLIAEVMPLSKVRKARKEKVWKGLI